MENLNVDILTNMLILGIMIFIGVVCFIFGIYVLYIIFKNKNDIIKLKEIFEEKLKVDVDNEIKKIKKKNFNNRRDIPTQDCPKFPYSDYFKVK